MKWRLIAYVSDVEVMATEHHSLKDYLKQIGIKEGAQVSRSGDQRGWFVYELVPWWMVVVRRLRRWVKR